MRKCRSLIFGLLPLCFLACEKPANLSETDTVLSQQSTDAKSQKFKTTLNVAKAASKAVHTNDVNALIDISSFPLHIRRQDWVKGPGWFDLGPFNDFIVESPNEFLALRLTDYFKYISISNFDEALAVTFEEFEPRRLTGGDLAWENLDIFMYTPDDGEFDDLLLFGVDPNDKTLRAIYYN